MKITVDSHSVGRERERERSQDNKRDNRKSKCASICVCVSLLLFKLAFTAGYDERVIQSSIILLQRVTSCEAPLQLTV